MLADAPPVSRVEDGEGVAWRGMRYFCRGRLAGFASVMIAMSRRASQVAKPARRDAEKVQLPNFYLSCHTSEETTLIENTGLALDIPPWHHLALRSCLQS